MKIIIFSILSIISLQNINAQAQNNESAWPNNKKAAICLTFDDGLDCHLDIAVPLLDSFNVKGTFYCTGNSQSLQNRTEEWRLITKNGHELGNHSLFHPCDGEKYDWVSPDYDLQSYTKERIKTELFTANSLLKAIDGKGQRTYGYTCSDYQVNGNEPFIDIVKELFTAARSDGPLPKTMNEIDVYFMPSWAVIDNSGTELIEYAKQAKENGTIAIFMFHSVGGGYLNVSKEALTELLSFLSENKEDYWVDTFYSITKYLSEN